jgi:hypothetical protein
MTCQRVDFGGCGPPQLTSWKGHCPSYPLIHSDQQTKDVTL